MSPQWFVGVDLAWSPRKPSGVAILRRDPDGLTFVSAETVTDVAAIAARISALPGDWYVAIDAPLVVTNKTGQRASDRQISAAYHRFHAGAHPTNLGLLRDCVRGGELVTALGGDAIRVIDTCPITARRAGRWAFETYPHPAMVELFGLDRIFKYKRGHVACRRRELRRMADHFRDRFPSLDPPLPVGPDLARLLNTDLDPLKGRRLKAHEDILDAVFCAYLALHVWHWGDQRNGLWGERGRGVVVLPALRSDVDRASRG